MTFSNISRDDIDKALKMNYLNRRIGIKALDVEAVIVSVSTSYSGMKFECRYFWNGDIKQNYFYDYELEFNL